MREASRTAIATAHLCLALALAACGGGSGGATPAPTVTLSANPATVSPGGSTQLTWTSTNASSCTASGGWSGPRETSGTASTNALFGTTPFTLSCMGKGGTGQAAVIVTIPPVPTISIAATPSIVRPGVASQINWTVTDATGCEASDGWSGSRPISGTEAIGPFTQNATFSLTCTGTGGGAMRSAFVTFRPGVNLPPQANAGPDQAAFSTATVQLAGNSTDDEGMTVLRWTQSNGPAVTLSDPNAQFPTFVAPTVTSDTVLTFSLTATDDEGAVSAPDTVDITVRPIPPQVTLRGFILYETIPFDLPGRGLNYPGLGYVTLEAGVLIEALDATTQSVIASGRFAREYQLSVPGQTNMVLRATAEMSRQAPVPLPHWQIVVRDLDSAGGPRGPIHSYTGPAFSSGAGGTRDIQIPSGWTTGGGLVGPRYAAPFAVLNSVQTGLTAILNVLPNADFPPLTIDWSPDNPGNETLYVADPAARRMVLSGEVNVDADEYDPAVILHEFGHYIDHSFWRSDSPGAPHGFADRVDMRLAFGEGLATAFSSIARGDPYYRDSFGGGQASDGYFRIEDDQPINEGWYSESSTQELLWDLFDNVNDGNDQVTGGFQPLFNALSTHAQTEAFTSIFSFMTTYKQAQPANAAAVDTMLGVEQIVGPTMNIYGSTETNNAGSNDVLPIYTTLLLGGSVQLRSTNEFGPDNKLSSHRFLRLTLATATSVRFDVTAAAGRDPDIDIYRSGIWVPVDMGPSNESFTVNLGAGEYVLDVYDCGNAGCNSDVPPAITDITIAVTPN